MTATLPTRTMIGQELPAAGTYEIDPSTRAWRSRCAT